MRLPISHLVIVRSLIAGCLLEYRSRQGDFFDSANRSDNSTGARRAFFLFMRRHTDVSYTWLARYLEMNHTSCIQSVRKAMVLLNEDGPWAASYRRIEAALTQRSQHGGTIEEAKEQAAEERQGKG